MREGRASRFALLVAGLALAFFAPSVSASTFDFAAFADGSTAGLGAWSVAPGEGGYTSFSLTTPGMSGIMVTVQPNPASWPNGAQSEAFYTYLDGSLGGHPGGLGVCHTSNCAGHDDDNVTMGEGLWLHFDQLTKVNTIQFRNQQHLTAFGGGLVSIYSDLSPLVMPALAGNVVLQMQGHDFYFDWKDTDFYIEKLTFEAVHENASAEPATLGLLGAGLLTLAVAARRSRSS